MAATAAARLNAAPARPAGAVDLDLHGHVGVRLVGAGPRERARVVDQLGPIEGPLEREPDITIRFVDRIEHGPLTYVGWPDAAFDDRGFLLLSGKGRARALTRLPLDRIGDGLELECERAAPAVPHLVALVNAAALANGVLPLHAAGFVLDGRGVLATGWTKGGKTEALLACMAHGASYVGDEWLYLTRDGRMSGLPEPMRLWRWHVRQQPVVAARIARLQRLRMTSAATMAGALTRLAPARGGGPAGSTLRRIAPVLARQANVRVPPGRLFGPGRIEESARIDELLLLSSHDSPDVVVETIAGADVAARMLASLEHERHGLLAAYQQFRFAFPDRRSRVLDEAPVIEAGLINQVLGGRPATWLRHPYPCDLESLYGPIAAVAGAGRRS